jgi:hypothetical protein
VRQLWRPGKMYLACFSSLPWLIVLRSWGDLRIVFGN